MSQSEQPSSEQAQSSTPVNGIRVWAQEKAPGRVIVTWEWVDPRSDGRDVDGDTRAVAATVGVLRGVSSATPAEDGVLIDYDPQVASKQEIATALRSALTLESDLKTRANALMKRAPAYANLARAMAMDERISPVPGAARQAVAGRASPLRSTPLRMIPGFPLISQLPTILPVLRSLSTWSRDAPPEVVDAHLTAAGLTRSQIDLDLATAHEAAAFARAYATEKATLVATKATSAAVQARDAAQEWVRQRNERSGSAS